MRFSLLVFACLATFAKLISQGPTLPERLGYSKETKLLIIHADDLGVSHSENEATLAAMEKGSVNSASIMVPTPWFSEIAAYAAAHPKADFGLHLTLTSEWKYYKWGPLHRGVPGLENKNGFLFSSVDSVYMSATLDEVEKELRRQIEKARQFGIDFTHFDSHMGTLFWRKDYLELLLRLGHEYKVPVMLAGTGSRSVFGHDLGNLLSSKDIVADGIFMANPPDFSKGMSVFYSGVLRELKVGLNIMIIHTAYDDKEMRAISVDHPEYGAAWRQADFNYFTSDECRKLLAEQNIRLVTWREIRDKLVRQ